MGLRGFPTTGRFDGWFLGAAFTRASDSSFTVSDTTENQAAFAVGRPIRYRATGGTWRYGIVVSYGAGTVGLNGAPMTTSDDDELQWGDFARVSVENVAIPGRWADAASTTLLASDLLFSWLWGESAAYLVQINAIDETDDSGASQPRLNVTIDGSAVLAANANAGIEVVDTSWTGSGVAISTSNYAISYNDGLELTTDANGSNNDSTDLSVRLTFVRA